MNFPKNWGSWSTQFCVKLLFKPDGFRWIRFFFSLSDSERFTPFYCFLVFCGFSFFNLRDSARFGQIRFFFSLSDSERFTPFYSRVDSYRFSSFYSLCYSLLFSVYPFLQPDGFRWIQFFFSLRDSARLGDSALFIAMAIPVFFWFTPFYSLVDSRRFSSFLQSKICPHLRFSLIILISFSILSCPYLSFYSLVDCP